MTRFLGLHMHEGVEPFVTVGEGSSSQRMAARLAMVGKLIAKLSDEEGQRAGAGERAGEPARPDGLLASLRAARREGHGLPGEAASLDPIGNFDRLEDLVRRYNAFEGRVADLLASTDELDPMWQTEWLRDPEWHSPDVFPIEREQLDGMARMIGHRA
jgi:hypothetical protein